MNRRGGSLVEFALCLPLVIVILTGVLDWGFYFSTWHEVQTAAREATRAGASTDVDDGPEDAATARAKEWLADANISTDGARVDATINGAAPDLVLAVSLDVPFTPFVGLVPTPDDASGAMTMRLERQF